MLQLDSDDLLDNPGEAQSAFYEGPGVSGPGARGLWWQPVGEGRKGHTVPLGTLPGGGQGAVTEKQCGVEVRPELLDPQLYPQAPQRRRCGPQSLALEGSCYRGGTEAEAGCGVHSGQGGGGGWGSCPGPATGGVCDLGEGDRLLWISVSTWKRKAGVMSKAPSGEHSGLLSSTYCATGHYSVPAVPPSSSSPVASPLPTSLPIPPPPFSSSPPLLSPSRSPLLPLHQHNYQLPNTYHIPGPLQ